MSEKLKMNNHIDDVKKEVETINSPFQISLEKLLPNSFVEKHTRFSSFAEMLKAANLTPDMLRNIDENSKKEFDKFISENTSFGNWKELASAAMRNLLGGGSAR